MPPTLKSDLCKLRRAIRNVQLTSSQESETVRNAQENPSSRTLGLLHEAHLAELNAVHALVSLLDLLERRQPLFGRSAEPD